MKQNHKHYHQLTKLMSAHFTFNSLIFCNGCNAQHARTQTHTPTHTRLFGLYLGQEIKQDVNTNYFILVIAWLILGGCYTTFKALLTGHQICFVNELR